MTGEILYDIGLVLIGTSALGGVLFAIIEAIRGKKLQGTLDREYGERPRR